MGRASKRERRRRVAKKVESKDEVGNFSRSRHEINKNEVEKLKESPVETRKEADKENSKSLEKNSSSQRVLSASNSPSNKRENGVIESLEDISEGATVVAGSERSTSAAAADDLEENTFRILKNHLATTEILDYLNEEEIAIRMVKTNKIALERARYQGCMLEESDDEHEFFNEVYQQEEDFSLTNDFFKQVITDVNDELKQEQNPQISKLDKKTVNCLKRALGLERNDDLWYLAVPLDPNADDSDHPPNEQFELAARRLTRGVARSTRIKRKNERAIRENIGVQGMLQAIDELEKSCGPFPRSKKWANYRGSDSRYSRSTNEKSAMKRGKEHRRNLAEALIAHMPIIEDTNNQKRELDLQCLHATNNLKHFRVVRLVRILVGRKHIRPIVRRFLGQEQAKNVKPQETKRKRKVMQAIENNSVDCLVPRQGSVRPPIVKKARLDILYDLESDVDEELPGGRLFGSINRTQLLDFSSHRRSSNDPIPLRLLDWQRRQSCSPLETRHNSQMLQMNPQTGQLPPILVKAGIGCLPKWEEMNPLNAKKPIKSMDPPRRRYTDNEYATRCAQLINCLNGPARAWSRYEFFYSDIDRAWYNFNEFAVDVAKLGVRPSTRLTRKEWSMIRRRIPNRPRRFSKSFIFSQLQKRNQYRETVRRLQARPEKSRNFDYEVIAPIPVGTTVTAYHKRFRVLHRGVVLFHDVKGHGYLVLFERKQLGYEFCPDTEVASHGVPVILLKSSISALDGSSWGAIIDHNSQPGNLPYGTWLQPPEAQHCKEGTNLASKLLGAVGKPSSRLAVPVNGRQAESPSDMARKVDEREVIVRLMNAIQTVTDRKSMILDAIEKYHQVGAEVPTSDPILKTPEKLRQHYAWLLANLELTNKSLEAALLQLRVMCGKAYAPGQSRDEVVEHNVFNSSKEKIIQRLCHLDSHAKDLCVPWMFAVIMDCKDTGSKAASTLAAAEFGTVPGKQERHSYLQHRLAAAVALLFTAAFCVDRVAIDSNLSIPFANVEPVHDVFSSALEHLKLNVLPSDNSDSRVLEADASRWFEARELEEATNTLYAELAAFSARHKVRQKNDLSGLDKELI